MNRPQWILFILHDPIHRFYGLTQWHYIASPFMQCAAYGFRIPKFLSNIFLMLVYTGNGKMWKNCTTAMMSLIPYTGTWPCKKHDQSTAQAAALWQSEQLSWAASPTHLAAALCLFRMQSMCCVICLVHKNINLWNQLCPLINQHAAHSISPVQWPPLEPLHRHITSVSRLTSVGTTWFENVKDPKLSYPEVTNQVQGPQAQTFYTPNKHNTTGAGGPIS